MRLRFGPPIRLDDLRELESHADAEEATRRLWAEIQRLEAELDAEERPPGPDVAVPRAHRADP